MWTAASGYAGCLEEDRKWQMLSDKTAHSLDEPLLILGEYPSRYLYRPLSINLFCFFPLFLPPPFSLSTCKFFEKWEPISEDADPYFPSSPGWMAWQDSALWGPNKPLPGWFPALRMHLVLTKLLLLQLFWYPQRHMVALHAGTHMLKKALNLKFMLADRALPEVGLTFTSTSLLLFKFTAHFPQRDHRRPLRNTRIFLYLLD